MLQRMATLLKTFGMPPHAPVFSMVNSIYTSIFPHERNDRCKFERRVVELKKKKEKKKEKPKKQ